MNDFCMLKPAYKHFVQSVDDKNPSSARAFWLSQLDIHERLYVMVCTDQHEVNQLETELAFFGVNAYVFADWETLVYDRLSVQEEIVCERIHLLSDMPSCGVLLISVASLMQRLAPPAWLLGQHFEVATGDTFDRQDKQIKLAKAGYRAVDNVYSAGEFAIRGEIIDVYVMGQTLPLRLELFDDEIERIRFFNPDTQRTLSDDELHELIAQSDEGYLLPKKAEIDKFSVLPAKEFPLHEGRELFRANFAQLFPHTSHRKSTLYQEVMAGIAPSGIEYYQPLFFEQTLWQTGHLFAYLPADSVLVVPDNLDALHQKTWEQIDARYNNYRHDVDNPIVPPELLYLPANDWFGLMKAFACVVIGTKGAVMMENLLPSVPMLINHQSPEPLAKLLDFMDSCAEPILLVAESAGRREIILELLAGKKAVQLFDNFADFLNHKQSLGTAVGLTVAPIERGLHIQGAFCVISEAQIFTRQILQTRRRKVSGVSQAFLVKSVAELREGSLVVHIEHGIGRYVGLVVLDVGDGEQEFIHLKYADDASIYVPITHVSLIGRYSGIDSEAVSLSKLGSGKWDKARQKTLEQIYDVAAELLDTQARRQSKEGIHFTIDSQQYELFASEFAFEETPDQQAAIAAVMADMKQTKPMDRLICGDVGFGKTEVAMRAAFIAVQAGYQVALLVPTTLLAGQHEDSFRNRFANWAIKIESLSRFGSKKHHDKVLTELAQGKVDIVIGTHRLLQADVKFAKLGLMIIDEEHRFGVRHKERIKAMQSHIDSLSMTATPIPRTLNMALSGMQDISLIATPPARRLAVKTFVAEKSSQTTIDAILREILRGGQVYYLHNEVASIEAAAENLSQMMPEVRVGVAHGQMKEQELSAVMSDFYHKKTNVLVASTIIETGIDVPNANTIIINRADKFGIAQLHQLRGRVGRSHHQAYCYLFVPSIKGLSADAAKRLEAISRANALGAGFMLASEDLEIRGAGELLGKEQSGNMQTIGFGLYMDMLNRATRAIKAGKTPSLATPLDLVSDVNMHTSALIPEAYVGDVHERLVLYKKIAACETDEELTDIRTEMIDRFGSLPVPLANLFLVHKVRMIAHKLGISKVDVSENQMTLEFRPDTPVEAMAIIRLIQSNSHYRMNGATGLKYRFSSPKAINERFEAVFELLAYLAQKDNLVAY